MAKTKDSKQKGPERDAIPLKPTKIFWVVHHTGFSKCIRILDITGPMLKHYDPSVALDDAFKGRCREVATSLLAKEKTDAEAYRVERQNWLMTRYLMYSANGSSGGGTSASPFDDPDAKASDPSSDALSTATTQVEQLQLDDERAAADAELWSSGAIAHWKASFFSTGSTTLSFPPASPHSSHNVKLKPLIFRRAETFVKDSVPYAWTPQHMWHGRRYVFTKEVHGEKREVGRFAMVWNWEVGTGGVLALDTSEDGVDEVVACLTALVVLKKKRQRDAERRSRGGGGGG